MKELKFDKNTPQGMVKGVLRLIGKIMYFKFNQNQYSEQIINQLKQKGALIEYSKDKSWIRVDIFKDAELIKLGDNNLDLKESTEEQIEEFIYNFYFNEYKKAGFFVR